MIESIITIKEAEQAPAKSGNIYLKVKYVDDKGKEHTTSIFDEKDWNLYGVNAVLKVSMEKSGNYWNIKKAEPASVEAIEKQVAVVEKAEGNENKSFAISYAKDLAMQKVIPPEKILVYAEVFNRYMNGDITLKDPSAFDEMIGKHFIEEAH